MSDVAPRPSLASQASWLLAAKCIGFALTLVLPLVLVRALDQHTYGHYRQIFVLITTALSLLPLGTTVSAFYFFPREPDRHRQLIADIVLFHVGAALLVLPLFCFFPTSLQWFIGAPELVPYAPAIGFVLSLALFASILETIATAYQEVHFSAGFIIGAQLSKTVLMLGAVWIAPDISGILISAAVQALIQTAVLAWYLHSRFPSYWRAFEWQFFKAHLRYALPLGWSAMLLILQRDLHHFFVSQAFGAAAYAVYAIGCFQVPLIHLVRESIASVMISRTSEYQRDGRVKDIVALTARAMNQLALVYWPAMAFLIAFADEFIVALFTPEYRNAAPLFRINVLMLAAAIPVTDPVFRAFAEHRFYIVKVRVVVLVMSTAALYAGTRPLGMLGVLLILMSGTLIERFIICWKTARILQMTRSDVALFRETLALAFVALPALLPAVLVRHWMITSYSETAVLVICGSIYGATYVAGVLGSGRVDAQIIGKAADIVRSVRHRVPLFSRT